MKKRIVPILILALAAGAAAYYFRGEREDPNVIKLSGNIELTQVNIAFKTAGRLAELLVEEGANVQRGQVIARLDRDTLLRQRDRERAGLTSAQSLLAQSATSLEWQRKTAASDLDLKRADLGSAEAKLAELVAGSRPQEVQEASSAVDAARSELERARLDWDRAQVLYKQDDISTAQRDQYRNRFETAQAAMRQAEQRLGLVREGPRREVIDGARQQVARARAAVATAEAQQLEVRRREQEIGTRQAEIDRSQASVSLIDTQIDETTAAAPVSGVVMVKAADQGEIIGAGTTIVTLGDIDHPWLRGYVGERDLGRVRLGQAVKVTTDSFPGKVYNGKITFIASEAEFTPKQIQTTDERAKLVYRIKVEVENPNRKLKSNMPADAEIVLADR